MYSTSSVKGHDTVNKMEPRKHELKTAHSKEFYVDYDTIWNEKNESFKIHWFFEPKIPKVKMIINVTLSNKLDPLETL